MQAQSQVSFVWDEPNAAVGYKTGVSLHSHTSASKESLTFIHKMGTEMPVFSWMFQRAEKRCVALYNLKLDFEAGNWRPPLLPRMAYKLERKQIEGAGAGGYGFDYGP